MVETSNDARSPGGRGAAGSFCKNRSTAARHGRTWNTHIFVTGGRRRLPGTVRGRRGFPLVTDQGANSYEPATIRDPMAAMSLSDQDRLALDRERRGPRDLRTSRSTGKTGQLPLVGAATNVQENHESGRKLSNSPGLATVAIWKLVMTRAKRHLYVGTRRRVWIPPTTVQPGRQFAAMPQVHG